MLTKKRLQYIIIFVGFECADVAELADASDSKSDGGDLVPVRVRPSALFSFFGILSNRKDIRIAQFGLWAILFVCRKVLYRVNGIVQYQILLIL